MQQSEFESKLNEEIKFRDLRYQQLKIENTQKENKHFNLFRNITINLKAIQELETLYKIKILIEKRNTFSWNKFQLKKYRNFSRTQKDWNMITQRFQSDFKLLYDGIISNKSEIISLQIKK
ncbi:unnamed protein product (macronuclear) [Paramecium tetraurelia]|uniref:Uncharacterized protein n=1 Tax=Paramecium tetraurelia TaxID=5888 RepID=A0E9A3_PARTE|nr:uncharacterized protein GSPATT00024601001 [Paramecium tetraurelia]CAK91870.1 unnamed protein product [Paramecium tetraurelia]|eukprot:XP_001459267.1 hypothetical protein (macronuclear) [Paramecium tetraurelia strain d4-2]